MATATWFLRDTRWDENDDVEDFFIGFTRETLEEITGKWDEQNISYGKVQDWDADSTAALMEGHSWGVPVAAAWAIDDNGKKTLCVFSAEKLVAVAEGRSGWRDV